MFGPWTRSSSVPDDLRNGRSDRRRGYGTSGSDTYGGDSSSETRLFKTLQSLHRFARSASNSSSVSSCELSPVSSLGLRRRRSPDSRCSATGRCVACGRLDWNRDFLRLKASPSSSMRRHSLDSRRHRMFNSADSVARYWVCDCCSVREEDESKAYQNRDRTVTRNTRKQGI